MMLPVFTSFLARILSGWHRSVGAGPKIAARGCSARTPYKSARGLILAISLLLPAILFAQVGGSISGRVADATGSGVNAAKVTVRNVETGATRVLTTDESGNYQALALGVGAHEIKVEKTGFKSAVRSGVNLEVGQNAVVNIALEVGDLVQQVEIVDDAPIVNTTTSPTAGFVDEREVKELPLNGRSFDNLITLNPGTVNYSAMKSANTSTSNGNTFTVAGRRTSENLVLMNGIEYT